VLEALAVHLGQPRGYFADKVDEGNSILRVIHYPPVTDFAAAVAGVGHVRSAAGRAPNPPYNGHLTPR